MKLFLVDSGALLAMIDARDAHHSADAAFVRANTNATFYLPDTIFAETMVLTKARLGAKPAIDLGNRLMKSTHFQIVYLTAEPEAPPGTFLAGILIRTGAMSIARS